MPADDDQNGMQEACARLNDPYGQGGQSELARRLGVKPQSVSYWCKTGLPPHERIFQIEDITGVPWTRLRPDLAAMFTGRRRG